MRGLIAAIMAILGVILVLSGAGALWATAIAKPSGTEGTRTERGLAIASKLPAPERLIMWGVVLLALAAVAGGAITFSGTVTAGTS
jgi:hypothetical protein